MLQFIVTIFYANDYNYIFAIKIVHHPKSYYETVCASLYVSSLPNGKKKKKNLHDGNNDDGI